MREGVTKHLVLLGVELYEISEKLIYDLRNSEPRKPNNVFEHLPEYTINTNPGAKNQPVPAEYFHQSSDLFVPENESHALKAALIYLNDFQ